MIKKFLLILVCLTQTHYLLCPPKRNHHSTKGHRLHTPNLWDFARAGDAEKFVDYYIAHGGNLSSTNKDFCTAVEILVHHEQSEILKKASLAQRLVQKASQTKALQIAEPALQPQEENKTTELSPRETSMHMDSQNSINLTDSQSAPRAQSNSSSSPKPLKQRVNLTISIPEKTAFQSLALTTE